MVLRYMVSDTDLAKAQLSQPETQVTEPQVPPVKSKGRLSQPKKSIAPSKRTVRFLLLLVAGVITLALIYKPWMPEKRASIWEALPTNKKMLTGILYNVATPRAIICGEIVREGETVDGYKVVKIHRYKVVLEKNGKLLTLKVH